jgi:hypothetical protein
MFNVDPHTTTFSNSLIWMALEYECANNKFQEMSVQCMFKLVLDSTTVKNLVD